MALSIVEVLERHGTIDQDALAGAFARRYAEDPFRGYAGGAAHLLRGLGKGGDWRILAPALFPGGSYGNGGAMRAAPIGAWFEGDPERAAAEAARSAAVTHAHPEGQAGAIAVAVATSLLPGSQTLGASELLEEIARHVHPSETRDGILSARSLPGDDAILAARTLGCGDNVSAQDTVPFCLWIVAHQRDAFEAALWLGATAGGDRDTVCAIVGGILATSVDALPQALLARRESLPAA